MWKWGGRHGWQAVMGRASAGWRRHGWCQANGRPVAWCVWAGGMGVGRRNGPGGNGPVAAWAVDVQVRPNAFKSCLGTPFVSNIGKPDSTENEVT